MYHITHTLTHMFKPVSEWQRQYVIAHINDRPRTKVAQAASLGISTVYAIVRAHGGVIDRTLSCPSPERHALIAEHYPTMSAGEISVRFGIPKSTVIRLASRLGLKHDAPTSERLRQKCADAIARSRTPEVFGAIAAKMKRVRAMERFRMMSGMPQQTRLRISLLSPKAQRAVTRLCREYGYFRHTATGGHFTLYYDAHTRRTPLEHIYTARYRVIFQERA